MTRAWILGVENIRPRYSFLPDAPDGVEGYILWHSEHSFKNGLPPHRTGRFGTDELALLAGFMQSCREAGYEVGEPLCVT